VIGEVRPTIRKAADVQGSAPLPAAPIPRNTSPRNSAPRDTSPRSTTGVATGKGCQKGTAYRICYTSVLVHTVLVHARHATARRGSLVRSSVIVNFTLEHPRATRCQFRVLSREMATATTRASSSRQGVSSRFGRPKHRASTMGRCSGPIRPVPSQPPKMTACFVVQACWLAESFGLRRPCRSDTLVPSLRGAAATHFGGTNRRPPRP